MSLESVVSAVWKSSKENFKAKRYFTPGNYLCDVFTGNISRTPLYAAVDVLLGVPDENVLESFTKSLGISLCGWSLAYSMGHSMIAEGLGETYTKHKKKIDMAYSAVLTFGFGMCVNLASGYTLRQAAAASTLRAGLAIPLGPITRYYTNALREVRDEPSITPQGASFRGKPAAYTVPRLAAMIGIPIAILLGALEYGKGNPAITHEQPPAAMITHSRG
jgi:hypothetical protein